MKAGWTLASIGDCVEPVGTTNPAKTFGEAEFDYVDLGAVDQRTKAITRANRIKGTEAPSRARQIIVVDDILVSTVRPNLNAVAQVGPELEGAVASTGFCVLRSAGGADARYLFHWVRSRSFVAEMTRKATGASYPAVSDRIVRESLLPLPAPGEQRRIARALDGADVLRRQRRDSLALLRRLPPSILSALNSGDGAGIERTCDLDELVARGDRINYGVVQPGEHFEGGVPLIRVSDLDGGRVDGHGLKAIAPAVDVAYPRSRIVGNEILLSCVGSIGLVALVRQELVGFNIARAVARIPIEAPELRHYVAAYLETPAVQRYFETELRTVAQPTLNIKQIKELRVPVPSDRWLIRFDQAARVVDNQERQQLAHLARLDALFASLQHRAFSGAL